MVYVAALIGLALGAVCGYVLRREVVETTAGDSDRRLKELRQLHASCGDRIRTLSLQVGQLESQVAAQTVPAVDRPTYELDIDTSRSSATVGDRGPKLEATPEPAVQVESVNGSAGSDESGADESGVDSLGTERALDPVAPDSLLAGSGTGKTGGSVIAQALEAERPTGSPLVAATLVDLTSAQATGDLRNRDDIAYEGEPIVEIDLGSIDAIDEEPRETEHEAVSMSPELVRSVPEPASHQDGTDLTVISGIGTISAGRLEAAGITSVAELAALQPADVKKLVSGLGRLGQRLQREDWVEKARLYILG